MILTEKGVGQLSGGAPSCPSIGMNSLQYSFKTRLDEVLYGLQTYKSLASLRFYLVLDV